MITMYDITWKVLLKVQLRKNVLNDVTAAPLSISFSQLPAVKKPIKDGAAVTSLRMFIFLYGFIREVETLDCLIWIRVWQKTC